MRYAAINGNIDTVKSILTEHVGIDTNTKDENGTALMLAVWYGHVDTVDALLNAGADVSMKNKRG